MQELILLLLSCIAMRSYVVTDICKQLSYSGLYWNFASVFAMSFNSICRQSNIVSCCPMTQMHGLHTLN